MIDGATILMADDDDDDYLLTEKALQACGITNPLKRVRDGEELIEYLQTCKTNPAARPGVILLDLNMPRKDGREALKEIKNSDELRDIPIVVFTTSRADEDISRAYFLGVNSFITKPVTFDNLVNVMKTLGEYWLGVVELPKTHGKTSL